MKWLVTLLISLSVLMAGCETSQEYVDGKVIKKVENNTGFEVKSLIVEYPVETGKTITHLTTEMNVSYELFEFYGVGDSIKISPDGSRIVKE